ncbi:hypothetical protein SDC9_36965 [bioreactor metagenome]|uniref:Uncharacterized protein n=1 Tax=bioreactor metagenome TaxID=1076179 RepID=A0A644VI46_9ZZZZ|nr:hypothetical protein [Lentimicrobium sp.]MEA5110368.1 hypothetical protein [Lentimicrobium sp.]
MTTSNGLPSSGLQGRILKSFSSVTRKGFSALWQLMIRKRHNKPLSNLYTRCSSTPLDVFIDALVNKNLGRLVIYGKATHKQINDAWELLFTEYCEISGSPQYQGLVNLTREIGSLQSKLLSIRLCVKVLAYRYSARAVSTLRRFGYNYKFNLQDPEGYLRDIKAVMTKSKSVEIALDQSLVEYDKLLKESDGKNLTEDYFQKALVELSKFMGFRVNAREVTVSEYVAMIKRREREIQLSLNQNKRKEKPNGKY